ncbi:hypothetical protein [Kitasatospora sp. McL0602]|uniref:hypothetical protein n=1 Tax=Kitasatospora sp. McL0602 TaxID=3439530 RepID=UPI003F88873D
MSGFALRDRERVTLIFPPPLPTHVYNPDLGYNVLASTGTALVDSVKTLMLSPTSYPGTSDSARRDEQ